MIKESGTTAGERCRNRGARDLCIAAYAVILLFILCSISSCSSEQKTDMSAKAGKPVPEHVTYRLKWLFNASAAGDIWAEKAGFFRAAGLDVTLREGGAEQDAITDIEMGRAQFGTASADQVIRAVSKGAGIAVLAQIFQKNPLQWIYFRHMDRGIKTPYDLKGLTIGITYGGNDEAVFSALMKKYNLSADDLNLYAVHYDYAPFWRQEVDLWPVYRNTEGIVLKRKMEKNGQNAGFFDPARYGINFVANSLITSRKICDSRPLLAARFTKALLAAWSDALSEKNISNTAAALKSLDPDTPVSIIREQLASTRYFVLKDNIASGRIDRKSWEQTELIMRKQGLIKHGVDLSQVLDQCGRPAGPVAYRK